jgi:hypothetical protein
LVGITNCKLYSHISKPLESSPCPDITTLLSPYQERGVPYLLHGAPKRIIYISNNHTASAARQLEE